MTTSHRTGPMIAAYVFGNFVLGTGVMIATGMLNVLASSLSVSLAKAGQLVAIPGLVLAVGAPVLALLTARVERRRLLVTATGLFALGHAACALAPDYLTLLLLRSLALLGVAVFTPQAAASVALLIPRERQGAALATLMVGWSLAAVLGMPAGALVAAHFGWRAGFALIAVLSLAASLWVAFVTPRGLFVQPIGRAAWSGVFGSRRLVLVLAVTLTTAAGQFVLLTYITPLLDAITGSRSAAIAGLMVMFGLFGVIGNVIATRRIDRLGADHAVLVSVWAMLAGLLLWGLRDMAAATALAWPLLLGSIVLWGLGTFSTNSAQQARLYQTSPPLAPVSIALNSSCMYAGQTVGASLGGAGVALFGAGALPWVASATMAFGLVVTKLATRARHAGQA
ncbi:MAG: MFS transporter [Burkholderiaceae bacterium]